LRDPVAFGNASIAAAREGELDFVIPISDASILSLLPRRTELHGTTIPLPSVESFRDVSDKRLVASRAASVGVRAPFQVVLDGPSDIDNLSAQLSKGVLVLKPGRSVVEHAGAMSKFGVMYAQNMADARSKVRALPSTAFPLLVQERIVGPGVGVFLLLWKGEVLASFAHRRIREKPPSGGVSVLSESVPLDPELMRRSAALLRLFDWSGVAMVEYKLDDSSNEPVLMEINGRFWGSLQLAVDAGVDFPALLVAAASDHPVSSSGWRVGVRSQWFWGYVDSLLSRLRHPAAKLNVQPPLSRVGALLEFLNLPLLQSDQVYQRDDRGPAWRELLDRFSGPAH
jgi:predicted ATP-grasp superfamily ATP-dependent carboligase